MRVAVTHPDTIKLLPSADNSVQGMLRQGGDSRRTIQWDIEDAARNVSWIRGSITAVANNLIGPGWKFVKVPEFQEEATDAALKKLQVFYGLGQSKKYKNFKDFYSTSGKFYATAIAIALGNFSAWEIRKDGLFGTPNGFDFIPGYIEPQIKDTGEFNTPAFIQYLSTTGLDHREWDDPNDIVFFARPDFGGYVFSSNLESLVQYTLPSDIYAEMSYLSMHKNRNSPLDGVWQADPSMSDEHFKKLEVLLRQRYSGARNYSKAPLLAKGGIEFKPSSRASEDAPYLAGRDYARQEMSAVTGVPGALLGVTAEMSRASSREAKRAYYETVVEPLQKMLEEGTYEQINIRLLGIRGWTIKFNNPAFVNEVEQASIDRTLWNIGARNANDIRVRDGEKPREGGDRFFEPTNMVPVGGKPDQQKPQGENPGAPVLDPATENPTGQKPRPVRADEQAAQAELKKWRKVVITEAKGERKPKPFVCEFVLPELETKIRAGLQVLEKDDIENIKYVFELANKTIKGENDD